MKTKDGWDWPWIYFTGVILLGFSEKEFWELTPIKFVTLWDCQCEYNEMRSSSSNAGTKSAGKKANMNKVEEGYVDQIAGW